jgi:hypothetical protein
MPGRNGFWLSLRAPPVRGWIIQQILKLGIVDAISERTLVFCDSDMAFFRRFDRDNLLVDGKIGLLDVGFVDPNIRRWTVGARRMLGLPEHDGGYRCHVGNMICWNRETVKAMRQLIETSTGRDWQVALCWMPSLSEYTLYGIFVREALGYKAVDHSPSEVPLVAISIRCTCQLRWRRVLVSHVTPLFRIRAPLVIWERRRRCLFSDRC